MRAARLDGCPADCRAWPQRRRERGDAIAPCPSHGAFSVPAPLPTSPQGSSSPPPAPAQHRCQPRSANPRGRAPVPPAAPRGSVKKAQPRASHLAVRATIPSSIPEETSPRARAAPAPVTQRGPGDSRGLTASTGTCPAPPAARMTRDGTPAQRLPARRAAKAGTSEDRRGTGQRSMPSGVWEFGGAAARGLSGRGPLVDRLTAVPVNRPYRLSAPRPRRRSPRASSIRHT